MNRVVEFFDPFPEPEVEDDYFVIESRVDTFFVTLETIEDVVRQLDARMRWLTFRDLSTRWQRILASEVYLLYESTARSVPQRALSGVPGSWKQRQIVVRGKTTTNGGNRD